MKRPLKARGKAGKAGRRLRGRSVPPHRGLHQNDLLTEVSDKAVTVEPVDEFALKGIRRPMTAYNVISSSPAKMN
jgi:hypothetical protein